MMRAVLYVFYFLLIYYAIKTVVHSAIRGYRGDGQERPRLMGSEMVLDPECRTYIIKERAVTRRINGTLRSFCSESCARQYEEKSRA